MTMEGKAGGDTDSGVLFPSLKTTIPFPERLQVVLQSVDSLADASVRRRLVKALPEDAGIDPMPTNNAPTVPQGDGEKAAWDRQVQVLQRLVVTLYLVIGQDKGAGAMEAEYSPDELLQLFFALLTVLSRDIVPSRIQAVDVMEAE